MKDLKAEGVLFGKRRRRRSPKQEEDKVVNVTKIDWKGFLRGLLR